MSGADVELIAALTVGAALASPVPFAIALLCAVCAAIVLRFAMRPAVRAVRRAYRRRRYVTVPIVLDLRRPPRGGRHR